MSPSPDFGLHLDARQRAMLAEMGIPVWWPQAEAAPAPGAAVGADTDWATKPAPVGVPAAVAGDRAPAVRTVLPVRGGLNPAPAQPTSVINSIANYSIPTGTSRAIDATELPATRQTLNWVELQQAVQTCTACGLCQGRKNAVFGAPVGQQPDAPSGQTLQADWLVVGDGPADLDDQSGQPFTDEAGRLLDNMLKAMGLSRHPGPGVPAEPQAAAQVFVTQAVKCRPPGGRAPQLQELAQCHGYLQRQIELLQPRMILALGRFAAISLLQPSVPDVHTLPLGKLRGQVHPMTQGGRQIPVVVSYAPAALLRNLPEKAKAWADLCLALGEMRKAG